MRFATLVALLFVVTPLAAQSARDTADIRAAADSSTRDWWVRGAHNRARLLRIVADTAWVEVRGPISHSHPTPDNPSVTYGTVVRLTQVRVERRAGKWVRRELPR